MAGTAVELHCRVVVSCSVWFKGLRLLSSPTGACAVSCMACSMVARITFTQLCYDSVCMVDYTISLLHTGMQVLPWQKGSRAGWKALCSSLSQGCCAFVLPSSHKKQDGANHAGMRLCLVCLCYLIQIAVNAAGWHGLCTANARGSVQQHFASGFG